MSPRIKVRALLYGEEATEISDLEQVRDSFASGSNTMVMVGSRLLNSYDELARLIDQEYQDKESVEIMLLPLIEGG